MKKMISLLMAIVMVCSMGVMTVSATNVYDQDWDVAVDGPMGTDVIFDAEADNDGDGTPDASEAWTVTVPAMMAPGDTDEVLAAGTWASNRKLVVDIDEDSVTLVNSINTNDKKELAVTFAGIKLAGNNTKAVNAKANLTIAEITNALFGEWTGTITYTVEMQDVI